MVVSPTIPSIHALLDPAQLAMIENGVPAMVASCGAGLRPSVSMALGCVLDVARGEITVFLSRQAAPQVLDDIARHGRIAVMFVEPRSHRAVQLKSSAVRSRAAHADDDAALARYLLAVEGELLQVGHTRDFTQRIMAWRAGDLVALSFAPAEAFNQAPGPLAGTALSR